MHRHSLELRLPGLLVPPLTPFDEAGRVDWNGLKRQVEYLLPASRPAAVLVGAVEAQEYQYLSFEERTELIRRTAAMVDGRAPFIVGVSHSNFRTAVRLAGLAAELGAAAIQLLIPLRPSGGKPTLAELIAYVEAIARETPLPIVAYHNPGPGANLGPGELAEIAQLESVQAFKESSRDLRHIGQAIERIERPGHARYLTTMEVLLATLQMGGSGGTMPEPGATIAAAIMDAFQGGRHAEAAAIQQLFNLFPYRWMGTGGLVAVMKAAQNMMGLSVGDPYPPFAPLSAEQTVELESFLRIRTSLLAPKS